MPSPTSTLVTTATSTPLPMATPALTPTTTPTYPFQNIKRGIVIDHAVRCVSGLPSVDFCESKLSEADAATCVEQTEGALDFRQTNAPGHYDYANKYTVKILCLESGSGMKVSWDPSAQYHDYLAAQPKVRVPNDAFTG